MYDELDDDEEMITPLQFGVLFSDWTNPQKAVRMFVCCVHFALTSLTYNSTFTANSLVWLGEMYTLIWQSIFSNICTQRISQVCFRFDAFYNLADGAVCSASDRKTLCQLLPKLYFPSKPPKLSLFMMTLLLDNFNLVRRFPIVPSLLGFRSTYILSI